MSLGLRSFVQESSQRSSNISWFDHVQFACASTQSQFEPRFYEGKSFSAIMPSISEVMKVYHLPCQEWGLTVISQRYDLMSSRPSDNRSVPIPVRDAAVLEKTLRSALESYTFQLRTLTALFRFSGDSGQIPLELWPSWRQEEENLSSVTWCLPSRSFRSAYCCQILSSSRRISGLIPDSAVQVRVGTRGSSSCPTHDPSPHDRLSSFSIHYTNIRGLNSNFSSVESHLATYSRNLYLLSETQLSSQSSPDPFQISHYNLHSFSL